MIVIPGYGMPIDVALQLMSRYIYEKKGVMVRPKPPQTPREIELFEQMIGYVFVHYNIEL
jgi:hypothetical protein